MTQLGFLLIVISAICHATWNFMTKKVQSDSTFIWLFSSISILIYFPVVLMIFSTQHIEFSPKFLFAAAVSSVLHTGYFILLNKGYRVGNLSIIYPLARGTGPLFSSIVAIFLLNETASMGSLFGILLILVGILSTTGNPRTILQAGKSKDNSLKYAFLCGLMIASYTVFDKVAVSAFLLPPILLDWMSNLGRAAILTPFALKRKEELKRLIKHHKKEAVLVGVLSPLSYILVLTAMVTTPVYYIAPLRELSILIGTFFGVKFLSEKLTPVKLTGITLMMFGIVTLSLT